MIHIKDKTNAIRSQITIPAEISKYESFLKNMVTEADKAGSIRSMRHALN